MGVVAPKTVLTLEIDGLTGEAEFRMSHPLPYPAVVQVFSKLIHDLSVQQMQGEMAHAPVNGAQKVPQNPPRTPTKDPSNPFLNRNDSKK